MIGRGQEGRFDDLIVTKHPGIFAAVRGEHESRATAASRIQHPGQPPGHEPVAAIALGDPKRPQQDRPGLEPARAVHRCMGQWDNFLSDKIGRLGRQAFGQFF